MAREITEQDVRDLEQWFRDRDFRPVEAVCMMGGMICELLRSCAPDPIEAADRFTKTLKFNLEQKSKKRGTHDQFSAS